MTRSPVNRQFFQVLGVCWAATKVCDLTRGTCLVHRETFLTVHLHQTIHHRHLAEACFTPGIWMLQMGTRYERETCRQKWRTKSRYHSNAEICKETVNHELPLSSRRSISTELHGWSTKTSDLRASVWQIHPHLHGSPSEAMLRIKEVEMVDSFDDLKSSHSIQGYIHFPNFEMLDSNIASALNKIIQNSYFKKKVSLVEQKAQKQDWFLRWRQIAYMIYDYFRVTGAHDTALDYADLFSINVRNDDVQEFDTRWDEILLSMSKIPPDDILESSYKLRNVSPINSKTYWNCLTLKFIRRYRSPIIKSWKRWWREA